MATSKKARGLYGDAARRIFKDRLAVASLVTIVVYCIVAILCAGGLVATEFDEELYDSYLAPSWTRVWDLPEEELAALEEQDWYWERGQDPWEQVKMRLKSGGWWTQAFTRLFERESWTLPLGSDFLGRDVWLRVIHGSRIAMSVGLLSSLIAMPIGVILGAIAGYFGGKIDELIVWFYSTVASVPELLLILAACMVLGKGMFAVYFAIGMTTWVTLCRLIRSEFMKHKQRDYVVAAKALGAGDTRCIFRHILPNVFHIVIINLSLRFVMAIKVEVILSYLGVGVQGQPSWGVMINDAKQELFRGVWWQLFGATGAMFLIVLAFSIAADALRDALDPKLKTG